jgi:ribosome-associated translation inhibitor RaiA
MINISHLDKKKSKEFDLFFKIKIQKHIIKHFALDESKLKVEFTTSHTGIDNKSSLHYHYRKNHFHVHAHGKDIFEVANHLISELEKSIRRSKRKDYKLGANAATKFLNS